MDEALRRLIGLIISGYREPLPSELTQSPLIALPGDVKLHSLEPFQATPNRFRGTFKTKYIESFLAYCHHNMNEGSQFYIDPDDMSAVAIMDAYVSDAPGWASHCAELELERSPDFKALESLQSGRAIDQNALIDFIQDWQDRIVFHAGEESYSPQQVIQNVRRLKLNKRSEKTADTESFREARSAMEQVELDTAESRKMPSVMVFESTPYHGLPARQIVCALRAAFHEDKAASGGIAVNFRVRLIGRDVLMQNLADELLERLKGEIGEDKQVFVGTMHRY